MSTTLTGDYLEHARALALDNLVMEEEFLALSEFPSHAALLGQVQAVLAAARVLRLLGTETQVPWATQGTLDDEAEAWLAVMARRDIGEADAATAETKEEDVARYYRLRRLRAEDVLTAIGEAS